jgi:L-ascorbate metabolism protein UlaG (beta-lactamase superfamily)
MQVKWYGHACFRLTSESGLAIVTDPYTPETAGYMTIDEPAEIAISSSDNDSFHCRTDLIPGDPVRINALTVAEEGGTRTEHNIVFRAIEAMEHTMHPSGHPDRNGMYRFELDGLKIAHMGDVGTPLTDEQIAFFEDTDILLALAGDYPTIALDELMVMIRRVEPKLVIPMHFRTLSYKPRDTLWIESFMSHWDAEHIDFVCDCVVNLTPDDLPDQPRLMIVDYVRRD